MHASAKPDRISINELRGHFGVVVPQTPPLLGGVIGITEIVDCVTDHPSKWFVGDFGFVLANSRPLPFVSWKGQLGIRDVPSALLRKLKL